MVSNWGEMDFVHPQYVLRSPNNCFLNRVAVALNNLTWYLGKRNQILKSAYPELLNFERHPCPKTQSTVKKAVFCVCFFFLLLFPRAGGRGGWWAAFGMLFFWFLSWLLRMVVCSERTGKCLPERFAGIKGFLAKGKAELLVSQFGQPCGCGSKLKSWRYSGSSLWFHLPRCHFGTTVLSHSHIYVYIPGVSMTLKRWGHYPKLRGHGPIFEGSCLFRGSWLKDLVPLAVSQ